MEIGAPSVKLFEDEIEKYCYMWRDGGKFSTKKYNVEKDKK
jgi:NADH dehydrogenase